MHEDSENKNTKILAYEDTHTAERTMQAPMMLDPDVRFLLANERTLLAWVRTSLTLQAGGLVFLQFGDKTLAGNGLGIAIMLAGAAVVWIGYSRFRAADRAIRASQLPTQGYGPIIQVMGITIIAIVLIASHLVGIW